MEGPLSSLPTFAFFPLYLSRKEDTKKRQAACLPRPPSRVASPRLQGLDMGLLSSHGKESKEKVEEGIVVL